MLAPTTAWCMRVEHPDGTSHAHFTSETQMQAWFISEFISEFDRNEGPDDPEALVAWYLDGSPDISAHWERIKLPLQAAGPSAR